MIDYIVGILLLGLIAFSLWVTEPNNTFLDNLRGKKRK
ncbi:uncharacterized protein METZ01_LOCUS412676 [marine metagenome]|uniref:Uncharacterized protein n=1 Tax=marine metagenome TaxID=408172 RepID=A0A382WM03_9ZZZZ